MMFMNEYEVDSALMQYAGHPVLGPATRTLENLVYWTNTHSDGWPYWSKPCRAAAKLQALIQGDPRDRFSEREIDPAEYRKALVPIKSFRTRFNADFEIVEV